MGEFGLFGKQIEEHVGTRGSFGISCFHLFFNFVYVFFFFLNSEMVEDKGGKWKHASRMSHPLQFLFGLFQFLFSWI